MEKQIKVVLSRKEPLNKHVLWLKPNSLHEVSLKIYNNEGWQDLKTINVPEELLNKVGELINNVKDLDKEIDSFSVNINSFRDALITETQQRMSVDSSLDNRITSVTTTANNNKTSLNNLEANLNTNLVNLIAKDKELETAISNLQKADVQLTNIVNAKQDELMLTVLDNGNIRIGNLQGQTKEFMPATPSGDPMHYAYINAGAEYNATGADIVKNAPWADLADTDEDKVVVHKAGYWYLNGLGDLTNTEMSNIYRRGHISLETDYLAYTTTANNIKTNLDCIYKASYSLLVAYFMAYNNEIIVLNTFRNNSTDGQVLWNNNNSFAASAAQPLKLTHILGLIIKTPQNAMIQQAPSLKTIKIKDLMQNISFPHSPTLTTASVLYMINNSTATSAITITLHADAYARAISDASIVEALAAHTNVTLASA